MLIRHIRHDRHASISIRHIRHGRHGHSESNREAGRPTNFAEAVLIALDAAVTDFTYGNAKYEPDPAVRANNWSKGMRWSRLLGACMRHLWT